MALKPTLIKPIIKSLSCVSYLECGVPAGNEADLHYIQTWGSLPTAVSKLIQCCTNIYFYSSRAAVLINVPKTLSPLQIPEPSTGPPGTITETSPESDSISLCLTPVSCQKEMHFPPKIKHCSSQHTYVSAQFHIQAFEIPALFSVSCLELFSPHFTAVRSELHSSSRYLESCLSSFAVIAKCLN